MHMGTAAYWRSGTAILVASGTFSAKVLHMTQSPEEPSSRISARLTALALRSSLPNAPGAAGSRWVVVPDGTSFDTEGLVVRLAESPTPLECEARWAQGRDRIEVTLSSSGGARAVEGVGDAYDSARRIGRVVRSELAPGEANPLVLVRGAGESILVTLVDLETWIRAYTIRKSTLGVEDPDQEAALNRASVVIVLGSSSGARIEFQRREPRE
jgi:hypothetical protein